VGGIATFSDVPSTECWNVSTVALDLYAVPYVGAIRGHVLVTDGTIWAA